MTQRRHEAPELGSTVERMLRALAVRATEGDTEAIEQLVKLSKSVDKALASAVAGARSTQDYSWQAIADLTGTTRQNAQQRFGGAKPPKTYACEAGCSHLFATERTRDRHHVDDHGVRPCPAKRSITLELRCGLPADHTEPEHRWLVDKGADQ